MILLIWFLSNCQRDNNPSMYVLLRARVGFRGLEHSSKHSMVGKTHDKDELPGQQQTVSQDQEENVQADANKDADEQPETSKVRELPCALAVHLLSLLLCFILSLFPISIYALHFDYLLFINKILVLVQVHLAHNIIHLFIHSFVRSFVHSFSSETNFVSDHQCTTTAFSSNEDWSWDLCTYRT